MALAFEHEPETLQGLAHSRPVLINEFFERQADLRPNHPAIECEGTILTYCALEQQSNQIAHFLRDKGVGPESLVGIFMEKSCNLFASILGVLKAGAGYVPIDPQTPLERILKISSDARLTLLLTDDCLLQVLCLAPDLPLASLDQYAEQIANYPCSRLAAKDTSVVPSDVCYVIYTSGSTGRPKGVVLEHRNVANFIAALETHYGIDKDDRIYQGFSVAFDASVEEIWGALAIGGTLVIPSSDIAKSPEEAAEFITSNKLTYFSTVPTFLSLIASELPTVRLLVVGGEACPIQLVTRWATANRRMLNTYGPTEASVVATLTECTAREPVTIGMPLPGHICHVLDDDLREVASGEIGELYIGGVSLARGYMNCPELTARHFISNPFRSDYPAAERLYKTRDLVRLTEAGKLEFIGRSDEQVKIRGFRIELSEIESVLLEHPSVRTAAVTVQDRGAVKEIAAYIVAAGTFGSLQRKGLADLLSARLPEYMQPKYLEVVDSLPTLTSGKIDRKRLPIASAAFITNDRAYVAPGNLLEAKIAKVWEEELNIQAVSVEDDFFRDLRGNSLFAAHVVTKLRSQLGTVHISVKDLYDLRTVRAISYQLISLGISPDSRGPETSAAKTDGSDPSKNSAIRVNILTRWICVFLQTLSLCAYYAVVSAPLVCTILICERVYKGEMDVATASSTLTIIGFATWPTWLLISVMFKWLSIGRYKAGRYPVWGFYYFRWWIASRFQTLGWPEMFSGTPLMSLYYRAMGARVGTNCTLGTSLCRAFDLVSIGNDTSIGVDAQLLGYRVENGWLLLGNVNIGSECFVGMHTAIGLNVTMGDRSRLEDASSLADGCTMSEGEQRAGSPLVDASVALPTSPATISRKRRPFLFGLIHLGLIYIMGYFLILSIVPSIALVWYALNHWGLVAAALAFYVGAPITTLWYATLAVLLKRLFIGRVKAGVFPLTSANYLRYWFVHYLMHNTRQLLLPVYATVFLPAFLRVMGAKIGKGVEISTILHVVPDLIEIEDGCFLADACIIGGHRIYDGMIDIQPNKIGRRTFIGNSALIPGGTNVGRESLIGVMSKPPAGALQAPDGTRWLGSPSFAIPSGGQDGRFSESQTFSPRLWAKCMRTFLDVIRILLPGAIAATDLLMFCLIVIALDNISPLWTVLVDAPLAALYLSLSTIVWVSRIKNVLVGRFEPTVRPLWCSFVWLNEVVNGVYETVASTALSPLMGTPYVSVFLRKMGCHIGRWVFLETTLFSEFDLVEIGDYAALNMGCTIQTHLFEDRVMKADRLRIGQGCSVGNMAVVLYSSEMKEGSSLAPLSVLMKGEILPARTRWHGIPSEPDIQPSLASV